MSTRLPQLCRPDCHNFVLFFATSRAFISHLRQLLFVSSSCNMTQTWSQRRRVEARQSKLSVATLVALCVLVQFSSAFRPSTLNGQRKTTFPIPSTKTSFTPAVTSFRSPYSRSTSSSSSTQLFGIPKMFRWLTDQYPNINRRLSEGLSSDVAVDNFYLDMNGIIHPCTHGNSEDEIIMLDETAMFKKIFLYVDRYVNQEIRITTSRDCESDQHTNICDSIIPL